MICKECKKEDTDIVHISPQLRNGFEYHKFESASTGEQPPHKLIEILENAPTEVARMEAARADHYMRYAARPSEPSAQCTFCGFSLTAPNPKCIKSYNHAPTYKADIAPQTSAGYLNKCVKEGPDCDCVTVCKFDPQPISGDDSKVEDLARQIYAICPVLNGKIRPEFEDIAAILRPYFPPATDIEKKYLIALRWFKLFYNFFQEDIKGKPSAAMSAMSEDSELQELLREADRIR
jgi:hypothetical protein